LVSQANQEKSEKTQIKKSKMKSETLKLIPWKNKKNPKNIL
jgi:hypothetical protein